MNSDTGQKIKFKLYHAFYQCRIFCDIAFQVRQYLKVFNFKSLLLFYLMCTCMHVCVHVCMSVWEHVCVCVHVCMCVCMCLRLFVRFKIRPLSTFLKFTAPTFYPFGFLSLGVYDSVLAIIGLRQWEWALPELVMYNKDYSLHSMLYYFSLKLRWYPNSGHWVGSSIASN